MFDNNYTIIYVVYQINSKKDLLEKHLYIKSGKCHTYFEAGTGFLKSFEEVLANNS